ncbi:MAG: hypothetical protein KC983_09735 [Phycisphaerales bacterium]|nr:hypothetical protein [Phycisphaerales bacterium]
MLEIRVNCMLAEYRALYALAEFRMSALDRRIPVASATLTGSLAGTAVLPEDPGTFVLVAIPAALLWLVRTTINHARSFEDVLRRIEQLEGQLNAAVLKRVVSFQTRHPSRGVTVGGRTGRESIHAVLVAAMMMIAGCGVMFLRMADDSTWWTLAYVGYLALVLGSLLRTSVVLGQYQYMPSSSNSRNRDA